MGKDWTGNSLSVYKNLGASNHTETDREKNDYYATDPKALDALYKSFVIPDNIWECACGEGHLSKKLQEYGINVYSSDLIDRGFGDGNVDFLLQNKMPDGCKNILTNPPYKYATEFVEHALNLLDDGCYCIMFLKTTFLEGQKRYDRIFKNDPPKYVSQFVKRVECGLNGHFNGGSAVAYAWFIWKKGFKGHTQIDWI